MSSRTSWCAVSLGLGLAISMACQATDAASFDRAPSVVIVRRPRPAVRRVDVAPFLREGCVRKQDELDCANAPAIKAFGCDDDALHVDDALGGLTPQTAIAECNAANALDDPAEGIVRLGCQYPLYRRYLIAEGGHLRLVKTADEFRATFAPVESPAEALGFAVALSSARPMYSIAVMPDRRFLARSIDTTFAAPTPGGFLVHLFETEICGCSHHPTSAVDFLVRSSGHLQTLVMHKVYDETELTCVD